MKIKKLLQSCLFGSAIILSGAVLAGCEGPSVTGIQIKSGITTTVVKGASIDTENVSAKIIFSDGSTRDVTENDLTFGKPDTATTGTKTLTIKLNGYDYVANLPIKIVSSASAVNEISSFSSMLWTDYLANKVSDEFTIKNNILLAGDDNAFDMQISAAGVDVSGEIVDDLEKVECVYTLKKLNQSSEFEAVTASDYATIDTAKNTLAFKQTALNQIFEITAVPENFNANSFGANGAKVTVKVKVVDGYNVYSATDLAVLGNDTNNGWSAFKTEKNIPTENVNAIILQKDISITKNDVPTNYFYQTDEGLTSKTNLTVAGSMKDSDGLSIYNRIMLNQNDKFAIFGNYFQINYENLPRAVIEGLGGDGIIVDKEHPENPTGERAITTHTNLFTIQGQQSDINFEMKDISFKGNGQRSARSLYSGGIMIAKINCVNSVVDNISFKDSFIGFLYGRAGEATADRTVAHILSNSKGANCYNTLLYVQGVPGNSSHSGLTIKNSEFVGAGGPALIVDHAENEKTTGAGGYPCNVDIIASKIESYVTGNEPWFVTYKANTIMTQFYTANALFDGSAGLPNTGKILTTTKNGVANMFNLKVVYKSADSAGMSTSVVRGKVTEYKTQNDFEAKNMFGLDMENAVALKARANGASGPIYFQSDVNGGHINQGYGTLNADASIGEFKANALYNSLKQTALAPLMTGWETKTFADKQTTLNTVLNTMASNNMIDGVYISKAQNASAYTINTIFDEVDGWSGKTSSEKATALNSQITTWQNTPFYNANNINVYLPNGMGAVFELLDAPQD